MWGFFLLLSYMGTTTALYTAKDLDKGLIQGVHSLENKVGNTPLHPITRLFNKNKVNIYAKKEWMQLSGSVKARAAYNIIRKAIEKGELTEQKILLDATSGNTGIDY